VFFYKSWAPFFQIKQRWAPFLAKFSGILPGFSTNQNFGCVLAPLPPTPLAMSQT